MILDVLKGLFCTANPVKVSSVSTIFQLLLLLSAGESCCTGAGIGYLTLRNLMPVSIWSRFPCYKW